MYTLYHGDCLDILPTLPAQSVDAIIADPPYGTTACKWDSVIPLEPMWRELKRVIKPNGAIALFGSQPFTSVLVSSNVGWFRHEWVWEKSKAASFALCNIRPMQVAEYVTVFGYPSINYYPQMEALAAPYVRVFEGNKIFTQRHETAPLASDLPTEKEYTHSYPRNVVRFSNVFGGKVHPTQKPVELLRYLVRTYTNPGETVLDFTMGSGTCGVACAMEGRHFIGVELDAGYYNIAQRRIEQVQPALMEAAD